MTALVPWTAGELAAIDVLRGVTSGTVVIDTLESDEGIQTEQTVVMTRHGPVVLLTWVPESDVPERHRIRVRQTVNRVRRRLNLGPIRVRWVGPPRWVDGETILVHEPSRSHPTFETPVEPGRERAIGGITSRVLPWTISLHVALSGESLVRTTVHECRHVDQLWGRAGHVPEAEREADAMAFADAWMEEQR